MTNTVLAGLPMTWAADNSSQNLAGGLLFTHAAGSTTPLATFQDLAGTVPNTNPIILDANGRATVRYQAGVAYKLVLTLADGITVLQSVDNYYPPVSDQTSIGALLYPRTSAEIAAGITPSNYVYPSLNVMRYGAAADGVTDDTGAFSNAISVAAVGGGTVTVPAANFAVSPGQMVIPASVIIRGAGKRATVLLATANGTAALFTLGGTATSLYYGCGLTDLAVQWTGTTGTVVLAQGTVGAEIARLYLEGETRTAGRLTAGVVIDGSNASAFFNKIDSVECNHFHTGFSVGTTGSQIATAQVFINCNATGDVTADTSSIGLFFNSACGDDSLVMGCDFESCSYGVDIGGSVSGAGVGPITFVSLRAESNTGADVILRGSINPCTFIGCHLESSPAIVDDSGTGFEKHRFIGTFPPTAHGDQLYLASCISQSTSDIPLTVQGYPAQTATILQVTNNAGTPNFQVTPAGSIGLWGATPPTSRANGFGAPTGASGTTNFPGTAATLAQCGGMISTILNILLARGDIGA